MDREPAPWTAPRLETPSLHFGRVPDGCSVARPIVIAGPTDRPLDLEVVVPPLAPFSIAEGPERRPPGVSPTDEPSGREERSQLWIRYDANRPMARDRGEVVVASPATGQRWTIDLTGSEARAGR